jgi:hypothetical protein
MTSRPESAPEFVPNAAEGLIPNVVADGGGCSPYSPSSYPYSPYSPYSPYPKLTKTICGLRPLTFWLATIILVLVIAGAVGGGVGGSIACRPCSQGQGQAQTLESQRHVSIHKLLLNTLISYISFIHQVKLYLICSIRYTSPEQYLIPLPP